MNATGATLTYAVGENQVFPLVKYLELSHLRLCSYSIYQ